MATCTKKYTFQWEIRNLQYSWLKAGQSIESAAFFINEPPFPASRWSLILYPKGKVNDNCVSIYLQRRTPSHENKAFEISFQIAILDKCGSILKVRNISKTSFQQNDVSGIEEFATEAEIFGTEKEKYFPRDILIVQCTLFTKDNVPISAINQRSFANFKTNLRSFFWHINEFSSLIPLKINLFNLFNESGKDIGYFGLASGLKGDIILILYDMDKSIKFFSFEISVIDSQKKKIKFGSHIFFDWNSGAIRKQLISKKELLLDKNRYLPNDVLSLECEYAISNESAINAREEINFGIISPILAEDQLENKKNPNLSLNKPHQTQTLVDDLNSLYTGAVLCDIELRTSTKTFPAHKSILCARSPVFLRMFSSDMKEKNIGHVDITDLEEDTVHRMLTYIYTDSLGDLQFESASKLYSAADKYAILSLKEKCSCFLKDNLSPNNACDLLILADRHQDEDLKCAVQDYILSHDKDVFASLEWKDFMVTNLQLAADIMYRKVCPS